MQIQLIYFATAFVGFVLASYFDIKTREIPPSISYSLILLGLILHGFESYAIMDIYPLTFSFFIGVIAFIFAYFLYRIGVWAGGDVKLFTGLGFILPSFGKLDFFPFLALGTALIAVLPFLIVYVSYFFIMTPRLLEKSKKLLRKAFMRSVYLPIYVLASYKLTEFIGLEWYFSILILLVLIFARKPALPLSVFFFLYSFTDFQSSLFNTIYIYIVSIVVFMGIACFKIAQKNILRETVKVRKLKEGMISAQDVFVKGKKVGIAEPKLWELLRPRPNLVVDSRRARGLTRSEIQKLKKLGVKELKIKKSLPFVPVFTLGLVIIFFLEMLL